MAAETRTTLKGYFNTGDKPTEAQFAALIDTLLSILDDKATTQDAEDGTGTDPKAWAPEQIKEAIIAHVAANVISQLDSKLGSSVWRIGSDLDGDAVSLIADLPLQAGTPDADQTRRYVLETGTTHIYDEAADSWTDTGEDQQSPSYLVGLAKTLNVAFDKILMQASNAGGVPGSETFKLITNELGVAVANYSSFVLGQYQHTMAVGSATVRAERIDVGDPTEEFRTTIRAVEDGAEVIVSYFPDSGETKVQIVGDLYQDILSGVLEADAEGKIIKATEGVTLISDPDDQQDIIDLTYDATNLATFDTTTANGTFNVLAQFQGTAYQYWVVGENGTDVTIWRTPLAPSTSSGGGGETPSFILNSYALGGCNISAEIQSDNPASVVLTSDGGSFDQVTSDKLGFWEVLRNVKSDCTFKVKVTQESARASGFAFGIMVRESLDPGAVYKAVEVYRSGTTDLAVFRERSTKGAASADETTSGFSGSNNDNIGGAPLYISFAWTASTGNVDVFFDYDENNSGGGREVSFTWSGCLQHLGLYLGSGTDETDQDIHVEEYFIS